MNSKTHSDASHPDIAVSVQQLFGIDTDITCPAFSQAGAHVPPIDESYRFDRDTTLAHSGRVFPTTGG